MFTFRNIWRCKSTIFGWIPRNTTCDAFMNKYICVRELIFRILRDVSLGHLRSNSLTASATTTSKTSPQHPGVVRLHVNAFSTTARRVTSPTWGSPPPCKQALTNVEIFGKFQQWIPVLKHRRREKRIVNLTTSRRHQSFFSFPLLRKENSILIFIEAKHFCHITNPLRTKRFR